jgi:hypothetical protein
MNPKVGQLMSMIMPSAPLAVFEADLPDVETMAQNKLAELSNPFGKYGSTKAEPFVERANHLDMNTAPSSFVAEKSKALASMAQQYGEEKAAPYLASIQSLQASLPDDTPFASLPIDTAAIRNLADTGANTEPLEKIDESRLSAFELALTDELGQALPGQPYELTLPNGKVATGISDEMGIVKIAEVGKGVCQLSLPTLDADVWSLL